MGYFPRDLDDILLHELCDYSLEVRSVAVEFADPASPSVCTTFFVGKNHTSFPGPWAWRYECSRGECRGGSRLILVSLLPSL